MNCEESKPMRVLLTGASGYLGQAIYKMGQNCFDWNLFDWQEPELGKADWIRGDILNKDEVQKACIGCDAIIHTAGLHTVKWNKLGDEKSFTINTTGTRYILEAAVSSGIPRVIATTSIRAVHHECPSDHPTTETTIPHPNELYGLSKHISEIYCQYHSRVNGLETICLRPAAIRTATPGVISLHFLFEWVDVRDVAWAHLRSLQVSMEKRHETMIIASNTPMIHQNADEFIADPEDTLRRIVMQMQLDPDLLTKFEGYHHYMNRDPRTIEWFSIDKAGRLLGYEPRYGFAYWPNPDEATAYESFQCNE